MRKLSSIVALGLVFFGGVAAHAQLTSPKPISQNAVTAGTAVGLPAATGALAFTLRTAMIPYFFTVTNRLVTCINHPDLNGKKNSVVTVTFDGDDLSTGEGSGDNFFGINATRYGITHVMLGANLKKAVARIHPEVLSPGTVPNIDDQWCIVTPYGMVQTTAISGPDVTSAQRQLAQDLANARANISLVYGYSRFHVFAVPRP